MKTKSRLIALVVLAAMMILAIPAVSSAAEDPWASVTPTSFECAKLDSCDVCPVGGSDVMRKYVLTSEKKDYNFNRGIGTVDVYTFSFSLMAEEGKKILPLLFRERGYNASDAKSDGNVVSLGSDGVIYARLDGSSTPIGKINSTELTNVSVTMDRTQGKAFFFVNQKFILSQAIPEAWATSHVKNFSINQNPSSQSATPEDPKVVYFGNYSAVTKGITEDDTAYFLHAFPQLGNMFDSVTGTVGSSLQLSFRMILANAVNPTVNFTCNGNTVTSAVVPVEPAQSFTVGGKTYVWYDAVYSNIGPQNVTDDLSIEVKDGETVLLTKEYSFKTYLDTLLEENPDDADLAALADAIVYYANESDEFLGNEVKEFTKDFAFYDFDVYSTGTDVRGGESSITSDDTGNKVWQSKAKGPNSNYTQQSLIKNVLSGMVNGRKYSLSFRYKIVSAIASEDTNIKLCYGSSYRQPGKTIVMISNPVVGQWVDVNVEFLASGHDQANPNFCLDYNGLGQNLDGDVYNVVWIDDVVIKEIETPGFDLKAFYNFDALSPGTSNRGFDPGMSAGAATVDGNAVFRAISNQQYSVVSVKSLFANATSGKNYRLTFKYNVERVIGGGNTGSFNVCYAAADRFAGATIKTINVTKIGEWQTGYVDFTFDAANTPSDVNGISFALNGLGKDASAETTYSILFDDISLSEMKHEVPAAGEKAAPVNSGDAVIKSANVYFDNQNKIIVKYESAAAVATKIGGVDVTPVSLGDNLYTIETAGIAPTDFDTDFTFTIGDSTLTYSVNDYVLAMADNAAIGKLACALYAYGAAAEAYAAE